MFLMHSFTPPHWCNVCADSGKRLRSNDCDVPPQQSDIDHEGGKNLCIV